MIPKFRAWIKEEKCFADYIESIRYYSKEIDLCWGGVCESDCFDFEGIELMQSTGLFDKNGKEIFEGDIVKRYRNPLFKAEWEYQIETVVKREACLLLDKKFGKNSATMRFGSPFAKSDLLEVIGNVYQNPELLEVTE